MFYKGIIITCVNRERSLFEKNISLRFSNDLSVSFISNRKHSDSCRLLAGISGINT